MNTLIAIMLCLYIFPEYSSSESIPIKSESHERNIIIDLNACFSKSQTICLSEIADSVTIVPFETTKQSLMAEGQKYMTFSIPYIFYNGKCFDWNGKFYGTIVKKGQGQYEINIMPDGETYANLNYSPLGNIYTNSIYEIVQKEIVEGKSWFRIRNQAPCDECVYQWLCPSPSDYEIDLDRTNLCHVNKTK